MELRMITDTLRWLASLSDGPSGLTAATAGAGSSGAQPRIFNVASLAGESKIRRRLRR